MTLTEAFWKVHAGLPRQAPGSDPATRSMLRLAGGAQTFHKALDISSGPGRAALVLAQLGIQVTAVDVSGMFADKIKAAAAEKNLASIEVVSGNMQALPFAPESFELIWAEGSVYLLGWEASLVTWGGLLAPGGVLVSTDCAWLTATPSDEAWGFWQQAYPRMLTVPQMRYSASKAGFEILHMYVVSDNDWFEEYYAPLAARHDELHSDTDPMIQSAIQYGKAEIVMREKHHKDYGYVGFILRKR